MRVGITATQTGLTEIQRKYLRQTLKVFAENNEDKEFHHGDCIEGDEDGFIIADELGFETHAWPGWNNKNQSPKQAHTESDVIHNYHPYLVRNHIIVDTVDYLIACPAQKIEQKRGSGTWATIRYARMRDKPLIVIYPDGEVIWENPN